MDGVTAKTGAPTTIERGTMDTGTLKRFAQEARRSLREQVSAKLGEVLAKESLARREAPKTVQQLEGEIARASRDQVIEKVAYTWFNRFTALRFMDANGYTAVRVVTPSEGQTQPEILSEAMAGVIGDEMPIAAAEKARALLEGRAPSRDAQGEAYRMLVVAACNYWHGAMPFLFEKIADFSELLMPEDLLSQGSILARLRAVMTHDACQDVEIIGWLYQFYISEKKDEVFAGLKKSKKIAPENIPAATQLFTPHWIVRYLVENSLGRLWMLNRPGSRLKERMDYYISPEEPEEGFLRVTSPEEIKVCDPACGSGHMLTYAFDLLYAIYEEEGYDASEIPALILTKNLFGIEIDERAGALAAFALTMKAAAQRKRFLRQGVQPNICVLASVTFEAKELDEYMAAVGRDLFTAPLRETLTEFEEADNFGSLIRPTLTDVSEVRQIIGAKDLGGNLFLRDVQARVERVLRMAEYLSQRYHIVVANPPYADRSGLNGRLSEWLDRRYSHASANLFAPFITRSIELALDGAYCALVTLQSWMFLSSFKNVRLELINRHSICTLVQIGYNSFPELNSKVALASGYVVAKARNALVGKFINLDDAPQSADKRALFHEKLKAGDFYTVNCRAFALLPGAPIAYWVPDLSIFEKEKISSGWESGGRLKTHDGEKYIRFQWEVERDSVKWRRIAKGGGFRRYYGNEESVADWSSAALDYYESMGGLYPQRFRETMGLSWTKVTSAKPSFRVKRSICEFDSASPTIFPTRSEDPWFFLSFLNSSAVEFLLRAINPTINTQVSDVLSLPRPGLASDRQKLVSKRSQQLVHLSAADWDASEISWDFATHPLLGSKHRAETLEEAYARFRAHWREQTREMQHLEEENNRIFIEAYALRDELSPEVPLEEITLNCNPAYRYGGKKSEAELEVLLLTDSMRELVSYAVGCMLGRYSLDKPGLILANHGEGIEDYLAKVPNPSFPPDADNVLPVLESEWFADDIAARFHQFLRVAFGEAHFQDNLNFVEAALGKDIRKYLVRDFFNDHVRRYKKRPIYWLFSSPKGTFNALIYMHRYRPDTVSVVLNFYLREFRSKLEGHRRQQEALSISGAASTVQKAKALKEIETAARQIEEIDAWERDVVFPLASQKIEIDLDDGVKANYPKFGAALKPIKGLTDVEE